MYFGRREAAAEPPCPGERRRALPAKGDFSRPTSSALRGLIEAFFPANLYGGTSIYAQSQESTYISYAPSVKCSSLTLIILVMSQPPFLIINDTPARLLKGAGKVGSAAKGTMSTRAAKALQSQEKLSSLTDLSKAASLQSVNKAKQMSKKQIERVEEMLDRYADMFGPNYVPAMGGAGGTYRFADGNYMAFNIEETGA